MGPRRRGKGGKGLAVVDGLDPEEMTKEQLLQHMLRMRQELDRERQERNSFQLECNRIQGYWEITRRELEERKAELRTRDREMEEAQERHQLEIKVYKQKVKHLLHEQQENLTELKAEGVLSLRKAQKDHWEQEEDMWKEKHSLNARLKEQELANEAAISKLCLKHEEEMSRLRSDFELQTKEMEAKYTRKMQALRDELDLRRKTEIHELEERKNTQISELIGNHEGAFGAIKNYYNDITAKNLTLINLLKEQVEELKKKQAVLEKEKADVLRENKGLAEPLHEAQEQVAELQKKLVNYYRDKEALVVSAQPCPSMGSATWCAVIAGQSKSCSACCVFVGSQMGIQRETATESSPTAGGLVWLLPGFLSAVHSPPSPEHISNTSQIILCSLILLSHSQNSKAHLKIAQKELKDLQWEHEVLEQRFSQVQSERDDLYQNFTRAINEVQQKTGYKNLLLEHKLHSLLSLLEQKEVELSEVLAAADIDPSALSLVSHKLEDVLNSKNATIQDLQIQLARVCKAHNDMLQTFEAKLTAFGIPLDNLGFQPLSFPLPGQELGKGPAGLVSVPT
uniref:Dynein regulatory complex subunit 4 n=1 Tax=Junco hyemalis TaxID=40217 RepID=A0A8C5IV88_JUNHY